MTFSILDILARFTDSELILSAAALGGAIYGIYAIYKKRHSFFFRYDEVNKAIQLGFLLSVIVSSFSAIIPGVLYHLPNGIDLVTAVTLAVVIGTIVPPLIMYSVNRFLVYAHKRGWKSALLSKLKFFMFKTLSKNPKPQTSPIVSVLANDPDVIRENMEAMSQRNRFIAFLDDCVKTGLITPQARNLIVNELPEIPDVATYQMMLNKLRKEREILTKMDTYRLIKTIDELKRVVKYYKRRAEELEEAMSWKARLPREIIIALLGALARHLAYLLLGV